MNIRLLDDCDLIKLIDEEAESINNDPSFTRSIDGSEYPVIDVYHVEVNNKLYSKVISRYSPFENEHFIDYFEGEYTELIAEYKLDQYIERRDHLKDEV